MSRRNLVVRIIVVMAITCASLIAADRAIGLVSGPVVKPVNAMGLTSGISEAGTHLRPGFRGVYRNGEFSIEIEVNSYGLRGPEIAPKELDRPRVLAIGDSFTFGQGVEYEQAWPALLGASAGVQVINAGWAAGSPIGYERYLTSAGAGLQPDLVLLAVFVGNDVVEDMIDERELAPADQLAYASRYVGDLDLRFGAVGMLRQLVDELLPNIYELATVAFVKLKYALGSHRGQFDYILREEVDPELAAGWAETLEALERMDGRFRAQGVRFGIVIIPFYDQVNGTRFSSGFSADLPQRKITSACSRAGLACLDLLPALSNADAPETLYFPKDGHWTPRGHRVAAAAIEKWLGDTRLLQRESR